MRFFFISILLIFISLPSFAENGVFDTSAELIGRTTPLGLSLSGTAGYGWKLWGERKDQNPWYGYIRPSLTGTLSSVLGARASIDLYPVSFFGVTYGRTYNYRTMDLQGLDCNKSKCKGWLNGNFIRARLLGKYQKLFGFIAYEKIFFDARTDLQEPLGEEISVIYLSPRDEELTRATATLGWALDEFWSVGVMGQDARALKSENKQDMHIAFARWNVDEWTYMAGAGRFSSTQYGIGPQIVLSVSWTGAKKIGP